MKYSERLRLRILVIFLLTIMSLFSASAYADIIIDNGGSGTSSTGLWQVSGGISPYGSNSLWSRDGATYTWQMTSQPAGLYEVYMWWSGWSSRATSVPVTIVHRDGSAALSVNQRQSAGQWNSLGQYYFNGTGRVTIVAVNGSTLSTCADAVRFVSVGGGVNQPPAAADDSAATTEGTPVAINVLSNDTDDAGLDPSTVAVVSAPGNGTAVPNGTGSVTYTPDSGFIGTDTFTYTVADTQGLVSNLATVTVTVNAVSAETVIDNGDPGTSHTGTWGVSGAAGSYGSPSVWSRDGTRYIWTFTPALSGSYELSMWWTVYSSRSTTVPVDIRHTGGTSRVTVNQKLDGSRWNVLGRYTFTAGQSYTVTVTSQPGPSSTCADAVKFSYLADVENLPPTAVNDTAVTAAGSPVDIPVTSNDTDDLGIDAGSVAIVTPPANGSAVPNGAGVVTYTPGEGYTGTDTFTYTVADAQGAVSNIATVTVTINATSTELIIDNGDPGTSDTGTWEVSGATGSYGTKSVWSRNGTTYTWAFTPAVTGNYQVSMWWTVYSSRSTTVPVDIRHSGGTSRVIVNQKFNGSKWNGLGIYSLVGGVTYTVTVTSQPGPSSTCADAVKIALSQNAVEYVAVGDSITEGAGDDIPADGTGYEPILADLLTASRGYPNMIVNAGVGGTTSADGAASISSTISSHPLAAFYLVQYGSNDADSLRPPISSGLGLYPGDAGYNGSYKDNMQRILSAILAAGKTPYLGKVPYTTLPRYDIMSIQEYNGVIDELVSANGIQVIPPDFYSWFQSHTSQLADGLHPDGTGYQSMADLWFGILH